MSPSHTDQPSVTLVHSIPGRVRVRLSCRLRDQHRLHATLLDHEGVLSVSYNPLSRSVLVRYEGDHLTTEEIVLRIAFALSLDGGVVPVRLLNRPDVAIMSPSATYSGLLVVAGGIAKLLGSQSKFARLLPSLAGIATGTAVVEHGYREAKLRGQIDPEVLILGYLLTSFMRGNFLAAAAVTWVTTFGRHLLERHSEGVQVDTCPIDDEPGREPRYELTVRPDQHGPEAVRFFHLLGEAVRYMVSPHPEQHLLEELQHVSRNHGQVLEGFGQRPDGILMRIGP